MLEIILLISLTKKIGFLAAAKGLKPGTWKLYTVLAWFGSEIAGGVIGAILFEETIIFYLLAIACAVGSYFLIKAHLNKLPDQTDNWIDQIGKPEEA